MQGAIGPPAQAQSVALEVSEDVSDRFLVGDTDGA